MANPYVINWFAPDTAWLASLQPMIAGVPLVWNTNKVLGTFPNIVSYPVTVLLPDSNIPNSIAAPAAMMPPGNVRLVALTSTSDLSAINFTISAITENGLNYTATMTGPNNTTKVFPTVGLLTPTVSTVFSIIPDTDDPGDLVSVGFVRGGYTVPFEVDTWNQLVDLSFQISNVGGVGTISVSGQYTLDAPYITSSSFTVPQFRNWQTFNPTAGGAFPKTALSIFSLSEFPVSAVRFQQPNTNGLTGTFTGTIIQQGGHY